MATTARIIAAFGALAAASTAWAQNGATRIGAVGAVNPATLGEPPAASPRQLRITDSVVRNERITAGPDGLAQIMLLDQTTLTVGPNSEIVLDEFVYDPDTDSGSMALTLTRGALRFIGGRTTKAEPARIAAPGGLIAVRGGMTTVDTDAERTRVVFFAGDNAVVTTPDESLTISRPGGAAAIEGLDAGDAALRYLGEIDADVAGRLLATFRSPGDGGARTAGGAGAAGLGDDPLGPSTPPVSTAGQLGLVDDPADSIHFAGMTLDSLTQTPIRADAMTIAGGTPVVIGDAIAFIGFTFSIFDSAVEDGDFISLRVVQGGRTLLSQPNVLLTNAGQIFSPGASAGPTQIFVQAVNQGSSGLNTGAVTIVDGFVSGQGTVFFNQETGGISVFNVTAVDD